MLGITEKHNQFKKSTYFAGGKFVIYAACVYLAATFAAGCLGAVIGFPLLTFPLAMLISNPVVWVLMGVVLTAAYKMVVKPLFHLAKNYINGKRASKGEKSEEKDTELQDLQGKTPEKQARPKTPDRDSGVITSEIAIDNNSFLHQTEKEKNYNYKLTTTDIRDIAKSSYGWIADKNRKGMKNVSEGVYFACPGNFTSSLEAELQEYKNKEDSNLVFTSILNLNGNHWVTLVIVCDSNNNQFKAYYCDSLGNPLPEEILYTLQKTLKMGRNNIRISKEKQQEDDYNCGIFALENAHTITQMLKKDELFDDIDKKLSKYKPDSKQLEEKRKEVAKALKDDISRRSSVASGDSGLGVGPEVITYNTAGDGNCFFHAAFGDNSSGQYKAEKAKKMRMEWHKFLSQFNDLDDIRMSAPLKAQLGKVFNMFLNKPEDLTGKSNKIKRLAEYTNKKVERIKKKVKQLKKKLLCAGLQENEVDSNLKELAVSNLFSTRRYDKNYNSENAANSFLNSRIIYESYLDSIKSQNYFVFIEEIPILASLANIEIHLHPHISHNQGIFKPNPEMINEGYQRNNELWGNKKQETIYLTPGHYERAGIVEVETSFIEKVSSFMQGVTTAVCNIVKNAFSSN